MEDRKIATHYISDLQPGMVDWRIKVRVTSKSRIIPPNEERLKTLLFVDLLDISGEIRAVALFHHLCTKYDSLLEVGNVYELSNLLIKNAFSNQPPVIKNKYELHFQDNTEVFHYLEVPQISYNFTLPISEILNISITNIGINSIERFIDVIGVPVAAEDYKKGVNEDMRNIRLRDRTGEITVHLRGPKAVNFNFQGNHPVLAIKRGYLSRFPEFMDSGFWNEGSQTNIILADYYRIEPNISETYDLKNWFKNVDE